MSDNYAKIVDKFGNEFIEGAIVKVFHFTGARRRKYYMYKLVVGVSNETGRVSFFHLDTLRLGHIVKCDFILSAKDCSKMQIIEAYYKDCRNLKK